MRSIGVEEVAGGLGDRIRGREVENQGAGDCRRFDGSGDRGGDKPGGEGAMQGVGGTM